MVELACFDFLGFNDERMNSGGGADDIVSCCTIVMVVGGRWKRGGGGDEGGGGKPVDGWTAVEIFGFGRLRWEG